MKGKKIGYIRVSSSDQNPEAQLTGIELDKKYIEYKSAKNLERPELEMLLEYCREDDEVYVQRIDRLARNVRELQNLVDIFLKKNVKVVFVKDGLRFEGKDSPMAYFQLQIMGAFAEFERNISKERQREGIELAKKKGKYKGRKRILNPEQVEKMKEMLHLGFYKRDIAKKFNISPQSVYNYINREGIKLGK